MDFHLHVRVLIGMIVVLSVAHLLKGIALIVQHPKRYRVFWVHLVWVLFLFLYLIHFWGWEFNLVKVAEGTFPIYFFVAIYAILLYLLCTLFFPDQIGEYDGFKGYYYSRHPWICAVLALLFIADIADGFIKGRDYFSRLGVAYAVCTATYLALSLHAMRITKTCHAASTSLSCMRSPTSLKGIGRWVKHRNCQGGRSYRAHWASESREKRKCMRHDIWQLRSA